MSLPATDSFNQNTGSAVALTTYSASWSYVVGTFVVQNGNTFCSGGTGGGVENIARWNADGPNADQYSQVVLSGMGSGIDAGVACRCSSSADTFYSVSADGSNIYVLKHVAGAETTIASPAQTFATGDVLRLEVTGVGATVTLTIKRALAASPTSFSTVQTYTDTAGDRIVAAGYLGIFAYDAPATVGLNSWEGGNLSAGVSITPSVGSLALAGVAPSRVTDFARNPTVGALAFAGIAPAVTTVRTITPAVAALSFAGIAPTVATSGSVTRTPVVGGLSFTGYSVTQDLAEPAPLPANMLLAGIAPTVSQGAVRVPSVGALLLTGVAPTLTRVDTITPTVVALAFTGIAPSVSRQTLIAPSVGAMTFAGLAPSVGLNGGTTITPVVGALAFTGNAPTVAGTNPTISPLVGAIAFSGNAPTLTRADTIRPSVAALTLQGVAPSTNGATTITPLVGTLVVAGVNSTLTAQIYISPSTGAAVIAGSQAAVTNSNTNISPSVGGLSFAGKQPVLTGTDITPPQSRRVRVYGPSRVTIDL